ncbi:MAG: carboxypeptidase-like regulatory domain-containing protein, partial [Dysgonamonadaceae bacterium]|nr:carboxypeptidase-like regulatory domain-containing protein [Dysgonamonadaceae bacterium]
MKRILYLSILLFWSALALGQNTLTLSGTLIEEGSKEPVMAASVKLLSVRDSVYIKGGVTNEEGYFKLTGLSAGNYILKATYLGYVPLFKNVRLTEDRTDTNLGPLAFMADDLFLKEAIVEGKVPEVVMKGDTIEYDAKSYKTPENAVLEDLIKRIPGAEVDDDGNIKVGGKTVTQLMVDGKDFFKDDPQIASKNLPADMVEKLKVFNRKTEQAQMTGFDDGEEETVIDLTTSAGRGMNGTIVNASAGGGQDLEIDNDYRYAGNAFVNYGAGGDRYTLMLGANNSNNMGGMNIMGGGGGFGGGNGITTAKNVMLGFNKEFSKKFTLNGDVRFNGQNNRSKSSSEVTTISDIQSQLDKSSNSGNRNGNNFSANMRVEWKPNEQNTLILRPNVRVGGNNNNSDQTTQRLDYNLMQTIFNAHTLSDSKNKSFNFGGELDYVHRLSSKAGRVFNISASGNISDSWSQGRNYWLSKNYINGIYDNDTKRNQRSENDNESESYRVNVSYVEPLGGKFLLQ